MPRPPGDPVVRTVRFDRPPLRPEPPLPRRRRVVVQGFDPSTPAPPRQTARIEPLVTAAAEPVAPEPALRVADPARRTHPCARCGAHHMATFDCMGMGRSSWTTAMFARAVLGVER